jgi:hypothetical protein
MFFISQPKDLIRIWLDGIYRFELAQLLKTLIKIFFNHSIKIAPISKPPSMLHTGDRKKKNTAGKSQLFYQDKITPSKQLNFSGTSGGGMNVIPDYLPDFPDSHSYIRFV